MNLRLHPNTVALEVLTMTGKSILSLFICFGVLVLELYLIILYQTAVLNIVFEAALGPIAPQFSSILDRVVFYTVAIAFYIGVLGVSILYLKRVLHINLKSILFGDKHRFVKSFVLVFIALILIHFYSAGLIYHYTISFATRLKYPPGFFLSENQSNIIEALHGRRIIRTTLYPLDVTMTSWFNLSFIACNPMVIIRSILFMTFFSFCLQMFFIATLVEAFKRRYNSTFKVLLISSFLNVVYYVLAPLPFRIIIFSATYEKALSSPFLAKFFFYELEVPLFKASITSDIIITFLKSFILCLFYLKFRSLLGISISHSTVTILLRTGEIALSHRTFNLIFEIGTIIIAAIAVLAVDRWYNRSAAANRST